MQKKQETTVDFKTFDDIKSSKGINEPGITYIYKLTEMRWEKKKETNGNMNHQSSSAIPWHSLIFA